MSNKNGLSAPMIRGLLLLPLSICLCACDQEGEPAQERAVKDTVVSISDHDSIFVSIPSSAEQQIVGRMGPAIRLPGGNIAVLDVQNIEFIEFRPDGQVVRRLSIHGEGPGEFTQIDRINVDNHGNLYFGGFYNRKLAVYDEGMECISQIQFNNNSRIGPLRFYPDSDSSIVIMSMVYDLPDSGGMEIGLHSVAADPEVIYRRRMAQLDPYGDYQSSTGMACCVGLDGRIYTADFSADEYRIICYSLRGDSLFSFGMPYEPVRMPKEEIEDMRERARRHWISRTGTSHGFEWEPPQYYRAIVGLAVDGEGCVWARGNETTLEWDVFSSQGELLYHCDFLEPTWQECDGWAISINRFGILAYPVNPEEHQLIYILQ
ncbi:6-bladed beta-propeller [Candidatus Fermentibacteria bacterium]|nr:6-bladed beta-propeller [Candidatus Fermentibacteria bacterium]